MSVIRHTVRDLLHNQCNIVAVREGHVEVSVELVCNLPDKLMKGPQVMSVPSAVSQTSSSASDGECSLAPIPRDPASAKIALTSVNSILHRHGITPFVASLAP